MLYLPLAIAMMFRPTLDDPQAAVARNQRGPIRPSLYPSSR